MDFSDNFCQNFIILFVALYTRIFFPSLDAHVLSISCYQRKLFLIKTKGKNFDLIPYSLKKTYGFDACLNAKYWSIENVLGVKK